MQFDIPVMIAVALICIPIFINGYTIYRWEGALLLGYYVAYTCYLILSATGSLLLADYQVWVGGGLIPVTVLVLIVATLRSYQQEQRAVVVG